MKTYFSTVPNMWMKSVVMALSVVMSAGFASARTLSPDEALARVSNTPHGSRMAGNGVASHQYVRSVESAKGAPQVYLYQSPKQGYLVLSAEESAVPVLGYSPEGNLTDGEMPEQMQWWLQQMADEIQYATEHNLPMSAPSSVGEAIEPLLTCKWGQHPYYNLYTPVVGGKQSPTGCVATAMSQVMYYHKWPENPTGMGFAHDEYGNEYSMSFDGITFEWDKMTDTYDDNSSVESQEAVSRLMQCAGYAAYMEYGRMQSGADEGRAQYGLKHSLGYSGNVLSIYRDGLFNHEWMDIIYDELKQQIPVIYSGDCGNSNGLRHAFVCDGYDGNGYFHFNWGWQGSHDGYFVLYNMIPTGIEQEGSIEGSSYSYNHLAILNVYPHGNSNYRNVEFVEAGGIRNEGRYSPLLKFKYIPIFNISKNIETGAYIQSEDIKEEPIIISFGTYNSDEEIVNELDIKSLNLDKTKQYSLRQVWRNIEDNKWHNVVEEIGGLFSEEYAGSLGGYLYFDNEQRNEWMFSGSAEITDLNEYNINSVTFNKDGNVYTNLSNYLNINVTNNKDEHILSEVNLEFVNDNNERYVPTRTNIELNPYETGNKNIKTLKFESIPPGKYHVEIRTTSWNRILWQDPTRYFTVMEGVPVESIEIVGSGVLTGKIGEQIQLEAKVYPENATFKDIEWWSETEDIATVDTNGLVTLKSPGRAVIRATPSYNTDWRIGWWIDVEEPSIPAISITLDKTDIVLHKGESVTLTATIKPSDATETGITWHISDTSVAMIDNGTITAMRAGECEVTAETSSGLTANCHVRVIVEPTAISLTTDNVELAPGQTHCISAILYPLDVTEMAVTWASTDNNVTTVENGIITAKAAGECSITATTVNGLTATCKVKVIQLPTEITLDSNNIELHRGETATLTAVVNPENAADKTVLWSSSDISVAVVDAEGKVTAMDYGEATITATTVNGLTASCEVKVLPILVEMIEITPGVIEAEQGKKLRLTYSVYPENADNKELAWESSDETVATVTSEGGVIIKGTGYAVITASATDGSGIYATCEVTGVSGVDEIFSEGKDWSIYSEQGILLRKNAKREDVEMLNQGIYIITDGDKTYKIKR